MRGSLTCRRLISSWLSDLGVRIMWGRLLEIHFTWPRHTRIQLSCAKAKGCGPRAKAVVWNRTAHVYRHLKTHGDITTHLIRNLNCMEKDTAHLLMHHIMKGNRTVHHPRMAVGKLRAHGHHRNGDNLSLTKSRGFMVHALRPCVAVSPCRGRSYAPSMRSGWQHGTRGCSSRKC